ncbi:MAG: putative serine/threonine-protein kinase unc-51, partial [Streblomastix strix]
MEESELLKSQGEGAYGKVFLVHHPYFGIVTAKVIQNENFEAREWESAGVLSQDATQMSPFIIRNIAAQTFDKMTVIILEYANIGNLFKLIKMNVDIPLPTVRVIMIQILEGLRFIHEKGLIHRDIKGGNILLHNPQGQGKVILKIADFGEAKLKEGNEHTLLLTKAGTPVYMAPELVLYGDNGKVNADTKVDIWSFGILVYQILTHTFPFKSVDYEDIRKFMVNRVLIRPPTITDNLLWDLLVRMLSFDRHTRISAAEALQHPFFTGEQAMREISPEQYQLAQLAHDSQRRGDQN